MPSTFSILFVCMGNICRSPAAEGVMRHKVNEAGLDDRILLDSAGTGGWHAGERADHRMRKHASLRGYELDSVARQVRESDFDDFDLILVADQQNLQDIRSFDPGGQRMHKVRLFAEFAEDRDEDEVPDPYYGGDDGFEQVLDIVENGCEHLLAYARAQLHG